MKKIVKFFSVEIQRLISVGCMVGMFIASSILAWMGMEVGWLTMAMVIISYYVVTQFRKSKTEELQDKTKQLLLEQKFNPMGSQKGLMPDLDELNNMIGSISKITGALNKGTKKQLND